MKWIIGNVQSSFSSDNASSGQIINPSTGDVDIEIDDDKFPDALPDVPIIEAEGLFGSVIISWTYESKSYYEYELYASKLESFNPDASNLIFRGKASSYHHQVKPSETWYYRARAINTHGRTTDFSSQVKASTLKIEDGTEYFEKAAIADALIGELRLDRGWVGQLRGNWIDAKQLSVTDGNGKRTLDIDSFGNVNLDVTSLKIKNNSVATESFVSNAKNDAINSANNNTTIALENHYTKSETDSKISVAKDEINLGVSNTYETKTNVETKVASTLNSAKSYSDTKKTEAINAAATDATNKVNSAKTELNTAIGKKANSVDVYTKSEVYTKAQTDSAIKVAKDEINLGISSTYETKTNVETKINGVTIGGTNLLLNSHFDYDRNWAKGTGVTRVREGFDGGYCMKTVGALKGTRNFSQGISITKLEKGQQYTATVWLKTQDVVRGTTNPHLYFFASYSLNNKWVTEHALSKAIPNGTTAWTKYVLTFTMLTEDFDIMSVEGYARDFTGTIWWDGIKLEKGNKASDWSPSPLDISTDITNAKTDAINTASTDATNKVNSAKTELNAAIGKKANSADVYTKTQVYTKDETNSQINIAKEAINLGVSNTYETKANVTTKVSNAVVEARRITDSRNTNQNPQWYMTNYPKQTISEFKSANVIGIPNASTNYGTLTTNTPWKDASGSYPVQTFKSSDYKTYERRGTSLTNWGGWVQIENAIDSQTKANTAKQEAITSANNTLTTTIANYYTKAQTDSQINVAKNAITQSVSSTYATKTDVTSSINGVNSSISSLTTRISNAESKITDTAITNTVKKNFYTKEETNNQITSKGYQTSSQVQQTVNNLQIKFTESGGYNLIRNSSGLNGTNLWTGTATLGTATNTTIGSACDKYMYLDNGTTTSERFAYSSRFKLKPSTTYTLTGWFHNYTKCPSFDVHVLSSTSVDSSDTGLSHTHGHYLIKAQNTNGTWKKYTVSFTTPSGCRSGVVRIDNNGYNSKGSDSNRVQWSALVLSEGSLEVPWTPHPNEVYDGITTIDKNGVTVKGSNNAYTNFNSLGMNSFNNSGQQTMGIRNGGITFNPYSSNQLGAYITQSALWGGSAAANGLAISTANNGSYIALGTSSLNDANATLNMDQALTISAIDSFQPIGINFWKDVHAHGYGIRQLSHLQLAGSGAIQFDYLNNSPSTIYEAVDSGHSLYVMGGYQMHLGCMDGKGVPKGVIWMQNSTNTHSYTHWDFHNYTMYNMKTASTYANYDTRRISESYGVTSNVDGVRYLYKNVELVNGKAIRSIPLEYKGCEYDIVSIVCKGRGSAWVETEDENRFEINGECKSVNIEIIIYPSEAVMTASTQQLEEAPTLELPKKTEPEEALLITNEVV